MTKSIGDLNLEFVEGNYGDENSDGNSESVLVSDRSMEDKPGENPRISRSSLRNSTPENIVRDGHPEHQMVNGELQIYKETINYENIVPTDPETDRATAREESGPTNSKDSDHYRDAFAANKQSENKHLPNAILPLLRHGQYESSESSCRYMALNLTTVLSVCPLHRHAEELECSLLLLSLLCILFYS